MKIVLVFQIAVAILFFVSGVCKSILSKSSLVALGQTGVQNLFLWQIRIIGICEILGSFAFLLPFFSQFPVELTQMSALGFAIIMIFAAIIHYRLGEFKVVF